MLFDYLQEKGASRELAELIVEIARAVEEISIKLVHTDTCKAGSKNVYGEEQIAMDTASEEIMSRYLKTNPYVFGYCSEELNEFEKASSDGIFSVFYDPLDGSSLFDVNLSVGTIVGIYKSRDVFGETPRSQVAALYAVYGPKTTLVISVGNGVHEFMLTADGFTLVCEDMKIDGEKKYFAPGNLRATAEREDYFKLVTDMMREKYTLRYSGGMVPDVNHILKKGSGIFMYPGMPSAPSGKLRLLYECGPLAYLVEQAGGASSDGAMDSACCSKSCECDGECDKGCCCGDGCSDGEGCCGSRCNDGKSCCGGQDCHDFVSILDLEINSLTQKTPIFLGAKGEVERAVKALNA
ncbi:MAG: class 1 fructose-bisphosphatase [Candidatus Gracilibacteria bacterium]